MTSFALQGNKVIGSGDEDLDVFGGAIIAPTTDASLSVLRVRTTSLSFE